MIVYNTPRIDIKEQTSTITLNAAAELQLAHATLHLSSAASPISLASSSFDAATQRVTYILPDALDAGTKAELRVAFTSKLTDSLVGYYKSSSPGGIYALTHFEPTDARRAIPCWDEPLLKATFGVTMISRKDTVSLCNMSALDEPPAAEPLTETLYAGVKEGEWVATKFMTSPPVRRAVVITLSGVLNRTCRCRRTSSHLPTAISSTSRAATRARLVARRARCASTVCPTSCARHVPR
jgi:aminopeptidase 2